MSRSECSSSLRMCVFIEKRGRPDSSMDQNNVPAILTFWSIFSPFLKKIHNLHLCFKAGVVKLILFKIGVKIAFSSKKQIVCKLSGNNSISVFLKFQQV